MFMTRNQTLARLAARGNGHHAAQGDLGGSSVASVNFQTSRCPSSINRSLSPGRVKYSLNHSNRCQETLWVLDRQTNAETVPASRRQQSAVHHGNLNQGYTGRANTPCGANKSTLHILCERHISMTNTFIMIQSRAHLKNDSFINY